MINIISISILNSRTRGPKKVVENLLKGLDLIGYPYVINAALDSTKRLWIHDDKIALKKHTRAPGDVTALVGPNLFINPEDIPDDIWLGKTIYLQPSVNVKKVWELRGYKNEIAVWPVGIDTKLFRPNISTVNEKKHALLYIKNRSTDEIETITQILGTRVSFDVITYGKYSEVEFRDILSHTSFVVWYGGYESQGIGLQEIMSMNIPILVIEPEFPITKFDTESTTAPYWDEKCGVRVKGVHEQELKNTVDTFLDRISLFHPREFVEQNLSLEKQARDFVNLYDTYFHLTYEEGLLETLRNNNGWRNRSWWFKMITTFKEKIKTLL